MKILLVSSSSGSRGGGELYLLYIGQALRNRGHHVTLWVSSHSRMDELAAKFAGFGEVRRANYRNTYDHPARSLATVFNTAESRAIAQSWSGFDLVHINKQNLEDGLDLLHAARLCGIPSACTIHITQSAGFLRAGAAWLRDWTARRELRKFRAPFVTVLEQRREDLARFLGETERVFCIPNGVPLPDCSRRTPARTDQLRFVAVGRLVPQKNPMRFLEVAEQIHAQIPDSTFLWVGDGALAEDWDRRVAERGLTGFVQRVGWQSDVTQFLFDADVFLHVAAFEGLPLALLEGMSAGLPVAVAAHLLREMPFLNGSNSIAVTDDGEWIGKLRDRERLAAIGRAARALVEREFSHEKMAARYEQLYLETIAGWR